MTELTSSQNQSAHVSPHLFMPKISDGFLCGLSTRQKRLIVSVRSIDDGLIESALRENVAELFPPTYLFESEPCDLSYVWTELRNYLNSLAAALSLHSSRQIILMFAHGLYYEAEDWTVPVEMANQISVSGRESITLGSQPRHLAAADDSITGPNSPEQI